MISRNETDYRSGRIAANLEKKLFIEGSKVKKTQKELDHQKIIEKDTALAKLVISQLNIDTTIIIKKKNPKPAQPDINVTIHHIQQVDEDVTFYRSDTNELQSLQSRSFCLQTSLLKRSSSGTLEINHSIFEAIIKPNNRQNLE